LRTGLATSEHERTEEAQESSAVQPKESTGVNLEFFEGGAWTPEGFGHVKPPRWLPPSEKMTVTEITRRVSDDMDELVARDYPTYREGEEVCPGRHLPERLRTDLETRG
jgi:hypothetical protein